VEAALSLNWKGKKNGWGVGLWLTCG